MACTGSSRHKYLVYHGVVIDEVRATPPRPVGTLAGRLTLTNSPGPRAEEAALTQVLQAVNGNTDFVSQEVLWSLTALDLAFIVGT